MDLDKLFTAVMIIGYVILGLLSVGVIIKIASVYARYKIAKESAPAIELKDNKVLAVVQEEGEATILCKSVENLPAEDTQVVDDGSEEA